MILENIKIVKSTAVSSKVDVTFSISKQEAQNLQAALDLIQEYRMAAKEAIKKKYKTNPERSDWCSFGYRTKNTSVTVTVEDGMAG